MMIPVKPTRPATGAGVWQPLSIASTRDGSQQLSRLYIPAGIDEQVPAPLLVTLHTWSADYLQANDFEREADRRGWYLLQPNFRGPNLSTNPRRFAACGSLLAQHDIVDAVRWVAERFRIDESRLYLAGASGGGHFTMLMVGKYPDLWAAACETVGISDLARWREETPAYGQHVAACIGGVPGDSEEVDWEYRRRSPLTFIGNIGRLPVNFRHGRHDPTVPYHHSVDAFNAACAGGAQHAELFVFAGGHEGQPKSPADTCDWLAKHVRPVDPPTNLRIVTDEAKRFHFLHLVPRGEGCIAECRLTWSDTGIELAVTGARRVEIDPAAAGYAPDALLEFTVTCDQPPITLALTAWDGAGLHIADGRVQAGGDGALVITSAGVQFRTGSVSV